MVNTVINIAAVKITSLPSQPHMPDVIASFIAGNVAAITNLPIASVASTAKAKAISITGGQTFSIGGLKVRKKRSLA